MTSVPMQRHLLRARDFVDSHFAEPIDVEEMARAAGFSKAHFSRMFKAEFGETPRAYLLTRRLERAASLLRSTDWPVSQVCWAVGLTSVGSFTSSFTRTYGMTPTAWRAAGPPAAAAAMVPGCVRKVYGRMPRRTFGEDR
ncbi:MAG: helix-turn-helix transcriptional regulator [Thermoleophilia bacterium]|nr:helix-turn-helix transcriptional regulator [Thermoleophilia bacterium]